MKRLAMMLGFLTLGSSLWAAGNSNPLVVSSGSFRGIDLYENNSGGFRQAIIIGDATSSTTVTVDAITGLNVHLSSGSAAIGSITNTSFAVSTGGVTAAQGGTWTVNVATGGVTVAGSLTTVATVTNLAQQGGVNISLNTGVRDTGTQRVTIATNDVVPVSQSGTWDEVGINDSGNSITIDGTVTAATSLLVSSNTTIPAAASDAAQVQAMGDNEGRLVTVAGVPTALHLSTAPAAITGTGFIVLVASPASTVFTHMCGCSVGNTSATNTYVSFYPSGNSTTSNFRRMMAPANNFPTGYAMDCSKPFLNTTSGGVQVTVQAAASVSSLFIDCLYYQSTSP